MSTRGDTLRAKAIDILRDRPDGLRFLELVAVLESEFPTLPPITIRGTMLTLDVKAPDQVYKPARGLFRHVAFRDAAATTITDEPAKPQPAPARPEITQRAQEVAFYQPFADWLVSELEECTKARALGGNRFKDKWGTPDVIGIREPRKSDIIKPPTEIVSAEIKADSAGLITAFGQACAYKLFSHKSYIVVPSDSPQEDVARLDALGRIFGVGLILFDRNNPDDPQFDIRVRATKHEPDMFYVNKNMKSVEDELFS